MGVPKETCACTSERPPFFSRYRLALVREADDEAPHPIGCHRPDAAAHVIRELIGDYSQEVFGALYLDGRNRSLGYTIAFVGTLVRATVEPRPLLVTGLFMNALGMIAFHLHPSGDPSPSAEDLAFTRRLADAGELVGVRMLDHIIIGDGEHLSLRDRGGW